MSRRACALAVPVLLAVAVAVPPAAGAACVSVQKSGNGWTRLRLPLDTSGSYPIFAVDPATPTRIYVSQHRELWGTGDGGCTWTRMWTPPTPQSSIQQIVVPERASGTVIL